VIDLERQMIEHGWAPEARDDYREPTTHWLTPEGDRMTNADAIERYLDEITVNSTCKEIS